MTIHLKVGKRFGGVEYPVGARLSLAADIEEGLVADGSAYYPDRVPYEALSDLQGVAAAVSFHTSGRNLHTFRRALRRSRASHGMATQSSVRVLFLTDSTGENVSQNWVHAHWVAALQRAMEARWPDVAFEWINCGVGGRQVKNVLGYQADLVTANYLSQATEPVDGSGYSQLASQGETARPWPWTWMGPPAGVAAWTNGQIWADRAAAYNPHLVITSFGLNEYNRLFGYPTNYVEAYELLIADLRTGARWAASRPSIVIGTPYGDNSDAQMSKRNRIAVITRGIAEKHGCALLDGNRWYNIVRHGRDPLRHRVFGEMFGRHLRFSRDDGTIDPSYPAHWWAPLAQPTTSGSKTFVSSSNAEGIFLRRRASADCAISCRFSQSSVAGTGIARLFARVDPTTWYASGTGVAGDPVAGYEARYKPDGTLELLYRGTVLATATCDAWNVTLKALRLQLIVRGTLIEVWSAVGNASDLPGTGSSWARRIRFRHLQAYDAAEETVFANPGPRSVREDGYCGFGTASTASNTPTAIFLTSDRQALYIEWLDPLPIADGGAYTDDQLLGKVSNWAGSTPYNPDTPGGNVVNHMVTDGYEAVYAVPVAQLIRDIGTDTGDTVNLGWSGSKVAFTSNVTTTGSVSRSGTTATFNWTSHGYAVGQQVRVTVSGAADSGYNATHTMTATTANALTATVSSGLAASDTNNGALTLTTRNVEQILATIPVPAGWMGIDGVLDIDALYGYTSSTNAKTMRVRWGTTGISSQTLMSTQTAAAGNVASALQFRVRNRGADNAQVYHSPATIGASATAVSTTSPGIETSALSYLYITGQAAAAANEEISLESYNVRLIA